MPNCQPDNRTPLPGRTTEVRAGTHRAPHRATARGFTLIELMVVVVIIAVLSAIAGPSVLGKIRDSRTQDLANNIAAMLRNARLRALQRGSAVVVRFDDTGAGTDAFSIIEHNSDPASLTACLNSPNPSCGLPSQWASPSAASGSEWRLLETQAFTALPQYQNMDVDFRGEDGTGGGLPLADSFVVCFTPRGRTFVASNTSAALFTPLRGNLIGDVSRVDAVSTRFSTRQVLLFPNGSTRVTRGAYAGP